MPVEDLKISQLPEETTPQNADVFAIAVDLASVPVTKKITLANLITAINKPAGSSGQVQFNNAGAFGGDNDLFWDNANKRLGIGTTGPEVKLDIQGNATSNNGISLNVKNTGSSGYTGINLYNDGTGMFNITLGGTAYGSPTWNNQVRFTSGGGAGLIFGTDFDLESGGSAKIQFMTGGYNTSAKMVIDNAGNVGIGTVLPTISDGVGLHLAGKILRIGTSKVPATAGAAGNAGELCWGADYLYCCVATNTWKRAAIATW